MKRVLTILLLLLMAATTDALAQARHIAGRVLDERGEGLPGAGITVKGTTTGTVTDVDGNFQLDVPEGSNTLTIQSIGFNAQDVAATDGATVRLTPSSQELQGTVVTALAVRREKRSLGYGTTTINSTDLNQANNFSPLTAIQGKTAGVNITSSTGGPGGSTRVVMRGEKSLQGANQALIVVDGIPINNGNRTVGRDERSQVDFGNRGNDIDPDDIESISVLKGAVAAALYGEQGANGAIMITTKSGRGRTSDKTNNFQFTTSYTMSDVLKIPEFQNKFGQGDTHGLYDDRRENFSWGVPFDGQMRPWGQVINGRQKVKPYSAQEDNVRSFFNKGQTWENNLQLGGANDNGNYFISLNTMNNKGVVPNTFFDKYSIRFNGEMNFSNKFYSNASINYINTNSRVETQGQGSGLYNQLIQTPRDIPIWELENLDDPYNSMGLRDENGVERYGYYGAYTTNPYWTAKYNDNRLRSDHMILNGTIGYKPDEHWNIFNRLGVDMVSDRSQLKIPKYNYLPFEEDYYFASGAPQIQFSNGGYTERSINTLLLNDDLIGTYNYKLSKDFTLSGLVGANLQINRINEIAGIIDEQENGLVVPGFYNLENATGPVNAINNLTETRRVGIYGQATVNFRDFLFVDATLRNDWNSTVRPKNRILPYPSISGSWVFTEHLKNNAFAINIINYGKIRASYATSANTPAAYVNNPALFTRAEAATGFGTVRFPFQGEAGFTQIGAYGDPDIKPEVTKTAEVGTELSLLKDRINVDFTYYSSITTDPIIAAPIAPSSGYSIRNINSGEISNRGVELQLRGTPVRTASGFTWELLGTYTKNKNRVESLSPGVTQLLIDGISGAAVYAQVGQPYGAFYATDLLKDPQGRVVVDSATGLPQLDPNQVYKGSYQPRFIASWGTNLSYKGFRFNVLFNTKQGGVFYSRTKAIMAFTGTSKETENRDIQVFPNSVYQSANGQYVANTNRTHDPYDYYTTILPEGQNIVDASYVKLQEASLTYTFNKNLLRKTFLGSAYVSIYGSNLFLWTSDENKYVDPEMNSGGASNLQGFDYSARFSLRNYGIRAGITF